MKKNQTLHLAVRVLGFLEYLRAFWQPQAIKLYQFLSKAGLLKLGEKYIAGNFSYNCASGWDYFPVPKKSELRGASFGNWFFIPYGVPQKNFHINKKGDLIDVLLSIRE